MPIPFQDDVVAAIERHDRDLRCRAAIEAAWSFVQGRYPELAWFRRKSTARHLMWEHSVQNVIEAMEDTGVRPIPHHDTVSFVLDDKILVRLKKADNQLITKNYPTPLANLFHRHERDLFGHGGYQRVELVHVFNRLQTSLIWIGIVARDEKQNILWEHELRSGGATIVELPSAPRPTPAADTVLRPAETGKEKREKEDD